MTKGRLEAFSDGVLAIIITIMVLELRPPEGTTLEALQPLIPVFLSYVLSFVFVGIYWNNHHHLFQAVRVVNGRVLWANLQLLFWLSLLPFATAWMGEHELRVGPGRRVRRDPAGGRDGLLRARPGAAASPARRCAAGRPPSAATRRASCRRSCTRVAIPIALVAPLVAFAVYVFVALIWIVPDTRIERTLAR